MTRDIKDVFAQAELTLATLARISSKLEAAVRSAQTELAALGNAAAPVEKPKRTPRASTNGDGTGIVVQSSGA